MLNDKAKKEMTRLCAARGGEVRFDYPVKLNSTIAIGGNAPVWFVAASIEGLKEAKSLFEDCEMDVFIMGGGSNVLIPDRDLRTAFINPGLGFFKEIKFEEGSVTVGSGVFLKRLIAECLRRGFASLEGLVGIPGTVGGALVMNASYRSAISDRLLKVLVLDDNGSIRWLDRSDISFGYRFSSFKKDTFILQAVFRLEEDDPALIKGRLKSYFSEKMKKQPMGEKTLGCVFKNPTEGKYASAELIDICGLKGSARGAAEISAKHANFIVNRGGASYDDVLYLIKCVQEKVEKNFSVKLEPEIKIL